MIMTRKKRKKKLKKKMKEPRSITRMESIRQWVNVIFDKDTTQRQSHRTMQRKRRELTPIRERKQ